MTRKLYECSGFWFLNSFIEDDLIVTLIFSRNQRTGCEI